MPATPVAMPETRPEPSTLATPGLPLLHTPPKAGSVNEVVSPTQITVVPLIVPAEGCAFTVTTCVATALPQLLVKV